METTSTTPAVSPSAILGALGGGSGVDMVQLARDLSANRFAVQRARIAAQAELLETRISSAALLRGQLSQIAAAVGERVRTGDLAPQPTIADPSVATVSLAPGASASGIYQLEVQSLAAAQTLASPAYAAADSPVGAGTVTIRFGTASGTNFTADSAREPIVVDTDGSDTLSTLADAINAAGGGVQAYVATNASGAQLVLKGREGSGEAFTVTGDGGGLFPSNEPGDLRYLSWTPGTDSGQRRTSAGDAALLLDGVSYAGSANTVADLPGGLRLELSATNIGAPTRIAFGDPGTNIEAFMADLVAALNDVTATLRETAAPRGGELGADPAARSLKRAFAGLPGETVMPSAAAGAPATLGDLGLTIGRDGAFSLDGERLSRTLAADPEAAAAMFTAGAFGVFATLDDLARSMASRSDPGSLAGSEARYTALIERGEDRLERFDEQQERLRERLTATFTAADRQVVSSQSTLEFLRAQIAVWNTDRG